MNISFEIFNNKNIKDSLEFVKKLKKKNPVFISVTYNKFNNLEFIKTIKNKVFIRIIPHIICDNLFNVVKNIINFIKIKIFNFIIISGDNNKNSSFLIIKEIRNLFGHIIKIFSGIYLEEHKITKNFLNEILFINKKKKIGINLFISQFFFNINIINYFILILKKMGVNKNLIPGIFPKKQIKEILLFSNKCKIELPIWIVKNYELINIKNYFLKNLKKMKHLHFYTFNDIKFINYYLK